MHLPSVHDCPVIELPRFTDGRGDLSFIEGGRHVPFQVRRTFYLYDIPRGRDRGAHAHWTCHQFIVPLYGSFEVHLDDGHERRVVTLDRPSAGLHVLPLVWASELNFSPGAVCFVLASDLFDESDYIRYYDDFLAMTRGAFSRAL